MDKKKKDDYLILFSGAKISKREANKVGLGLDLWDYRCYIDDCYYYCYWQRNKNL